MQFHALTTLDPNKATGIDGIGPKILKYCAAAAFKPLHYLYSLSNIAILCTQTLDLVVIRKISLVLVLHTKTTL